MWSWENFGSQPIALVEQALEIAAQRHLELAHKAAVPIANGWVAQMQMKGVKHPKSSWINPYEDQLAEKQAKAEIPQAVARTFLKQHKLGNVPSWALREVNLDQIKLAAR